MVNSRNFSHFIVLFLQGSAAIEMTLYFLCGHYAYSLIYNMEIMLVGEDGHIVAVNLTHVFSC